MRNKWYYFLWTALGRKVLQPDISLVIPSGLPAGMSQLLMQPIQECSAGDVTLGKPLLPGKEKHIYKYAWNQLRELGFSRPLRLDPWKDVTLLLPFYRGCIAVLPQSFSDRIPMEERMLSLVGRSYASWILGYRLWIVVARWDEVMISLAQRGGLSLTSPDLLHEIFSATSSNQ